MYPKSILLALVLIILIIIGGFVWFFFGRETPHVENETPETAESVEKLHTEDAGDYHHMDGYYPSLTPLSTEGNAVAVFSMRTFVETEMERFKLETTAELDEEAIAFLGLGGDRKYTLEVDYSLHESADTVSYVYHIYADTLGAHPNAYYRTFTFDKKMGRELHIGDLFVASEYLDALSDISREQIRETLGENVNVEYLESGTTPMWENFQNFYLEGDVLVIVFSPYQVGPWAIGTQEARIPRSELSSVLKAEYQ